MMGRSLDVSDAAGGENISNCLGDMSDMENLQFEEFSQPTLLPDIKKINSFDTILQEMLVSISSYMKPKDKEEKLELESQKIKKEMCSLEKLYNEDLNRLQDNCCQKDKLQNDLQVAEGMRNLYEEYERAKLALYKRVTKLKFVDIRNEEEVKGYRGKTPFCLKRR